MMAFRPIALLLALFVISSCAYAPENYGFPWARCTTNSKEHLQGVDWEQARKLNLRIRQGDFWPTYLGLTMGRSYVLAIENADDTNHSFRAMDFFRAVAVAGVRVDGGDFEEVACLEGVSIPPGKIAEVRFVAVRDGSYEFDDNSLMISLAMTGSAGGFITIEPPRVLIESPLEHLKLLERKSLTIEPEKSKPTGLFDDQEDEPAPSPGLFDDQEETPSPPSGLFDDQEQPPAEPPTGLFDDAEPEQPIEPAPSMPVETVPTPPEQPEPEPDEGLFGEPVPEPAPEVIKPEPPVVDVAPELPPEKPKDKSADWEEELFVEEAPEPPAPAVLPEGYEPLEGPPADVYSDPPDVVNTGPSPGGDGGDDQFDSSG